MSRFHRSLTQSETALTLGQFRGDAKAHLQPKVAQWLLWLAALKTCFLIMGQLPFAINSNSILDRTGLSGFEFFTVLIAESSLLILLISRHSLLFKCVGVSLFYLALATITSLKWPRIVTLFGYDLHPRVIFFSSSLLAISFFGFLYANRKALSTTSNRSSSNSLKVGNLFLILAAINGATLLYWGAIALSTLRIVSSPDVSIKVVEISPMVVGKTSTARVEIKNRSSLPIKFCGSESTCSCLIGHGFENTKLEPNEIMHVSLAIRPRADGIYRETLSIFSDSKLNPVHSVVVSGWAERE